MPRRSVGLVNHHVARSLYLHHWRASLDAVRVILFGADLRLRGAPCTTTANVDMHVSPLRLAVSMKYVMSHMWRAKCNGTGERHFHASSGLRPRLTRRVAEITISMGVLAWEDQMRKYSLEVITAVALLVLGWFIFRPFSAG